MPYYATSQEWLRQSSLLLEARPSTVRTSYTHYLLPPLPLANLPPSPSRPA